MTERRIPSRSLIGASLVLLAACGSDSTAPGGGGPAISVAVVPATASLLTSGSQDFTAMVTNDPSNRGVTWSITGCSGGPGVCGSLSKLTSTRATYAAPATVPPGTLGVTATSVSDNSKSVTARVAITAIAADGQIAFISDRDGSSQIYLMNADGSGVTRLTNSPAYKLTLVWSPDGSKIAFFNWFDTAAEIYTINADGSGLRNLTNNPAADFDPVWSPDGAKIAFSSDSDSNDEIYVMNADGTGLVNLSNNPATDFAGGWSPDGTKIAFHSNRDGNWKIYVMNADGSGVTQLTNTKDTAWSYGPVWSPDGSRIAFVRNSADIYVMNADGSALRNLTNNPAIDFAPAWRPRGP